MQTKQIGSGTRCSGWSEHILAQCMKPTSVKYMHSLPPVVACTTGLSHNLFTLLPLRREKRLH